MAGMNNGMNVGKAHHHHHHNDAPKHVSAKIENGHLVVQGTNGADDLSVKKVGDKVQVMNGDKVVGEFPADQVKSVKVRGHKGNDTIDVDVGEDIKTKILGGRGRDTMTLSNAKDAFIGSKFGKDTINLNNATGTKIRGGKGTDIINSQDPYSATGADDTVSPEGPQTQSCTAPVSTRPPVVSPESPLPTFGLQSDATSSWSGSQLLPPARA